jgi:4-hydroxymandelate oxidase
LPEFLGDLVRPYGLILRPDSGGGQSYGEMLAGLIGDLVPPDQPADALILGFAMPDVWPGRATATFLSHVCAGNPTAFAVCDQGCAAGFTALRLARDYVAGGGWRRVLVAVAEQARLDYEPPAPASVPAGHAAFAMLCDAHPGPASGRPAAGGAPLLRAVRVCPGVPAEQAWALLGRALAVLPESGEEPERTLVLGEGLAPLAGDGVPGWRSRLTRPAGQPLTGVWRELAAWAAAPGDGSLAIADYDPGLRYLCLAAFARGLA